MKHPIAKIIVVVGLPLLLGACSTTSSIDMMSDTAASFAPVSARTSAVPAPARYGSSRAEASAVSAQVSGLVRNKLIGPDVAVQVALLNNKGLQAAYADVGMSAADVWQASLLVNPTVSLGMIGIDPVRTVEGAVVSNILAMITRPRRVAIAEARFRQAQLVAAEETLRLAADTRRAWINAVSAWETVSYYNKAQQAADAASALAAKLGETGAFTKTGQAREHVFYAELTGQAAEARLAARTAKEELTRLMGLWGSDIDYKVPNALPAMPRSVAAKRAIEAEALQGRVDLEIARLALEAEARSYGLTQATRYLTDLELLGGVEVERESDEEGTTTTAVDRSPKSSSSSRSSTPARRGCARPSSPICAPPTCWRRRR